MPTISYEDEIVHVSFLLGRAIFNMESFGLRACDGKRHRLVYTISKRHQKYASSSHQKYRKGNYWVESNYLMEAHSIHLALQLTRDEVHENLLHPSMQKAYVSFPVVVTARPTIRIWFFRGLSFAHDRKPTRHITKPVFQIWWLKIPSVASTHQRIYEFTLRIRKALSSRIF